MKFIEIYNKTMGILDGGSFKTIYLTNICTVAWIEPLTGWVCNMRVCPELSSPKPLDQSKNVTVRSFTNCPRIKMGEKKSPKNHQNHQKCKKRQLVHGAMQQSLAKLGEAQSLVVKKTKVIFQFYKVSLKLICNLWLTYDYAPNYLIKRVGTSPRLSKGSSFHSFVDIEINRPATFAFPHK